MEESEELEVTYAERKTVEMMGCLKIDSYRLPDGEIRVGLSSASEALGERSGWLSQILKRQGKPYKALLGKGFTDTRKEVRVTRSGKSGASKAYTVTINDFLAILKFAAGQGNPIAIACREAEADRSIIDRFREAWGQARLSVEEQRRIYCEELAKAFTDSEWAETSGAGQAFDWSKAKDPEWLIMMFSNNWQPSMLLQGIDMDQYAEEWYAREEEEEFEEV